MLGARHTRRTLNTKLRRDLRHQTTAFGAVGVTVLLGVALFGAAYDAYLNLQGSYDEVFDQLAIADIWVTGGDTAAIADKVALVDGVARVATRTQVDQPLRVDGDKLAGRLVGLPEPRLNDVAVQAGALPEPGGGVLAEQHLASAFDLGVGDQVEVLVGDTWQPLRLSGSAASGEYLWLAASKQELISLPTEFGVAFAPQATVAEITGRAPNQVLVRTAEDIDRLEAAHEVRAIAREHGAADVYTWEDQPSNAALQEDISGFSQMALLFPLLFLTAAAMASYTLLSRRIHQERAVIGMLRAQGVARREVLRHYLGYGLVAGLCGAIPGVVLGLWLARSLTRFYVGFLELPVTAVAFHPVTPVVGLTFGAVTGAVAAWAPARTAAAISPAAAMQGVAPATGGRRSLLERLVPFASSLPASWRLVLRSIGRNPRRSVMTAGGVTLALLLILVSWSLLDTVQGNLDRQFSQRDTSDAYVEFTAPTSDDPALADLRAVEGVTTAEAVTRAPVTITGPDGSYATALEALPAGTTLREFEVVDGDPDGLAAEGLLVGTAMRDLVGIEVGDTVTLTVHDPRSDGDLARVQTSIAGFVREALG
ncbi:MAG: ABC transporter permease, partial [Actinomycetota bacterium]